MAVIITLIIECIVSVLIGYGYLQRIVIYGYFGFNALIVFVCFLLLISLLGMFFRREAARVFHNVVLVVIVIVLLSFLFIAYCKAVPINMVGEWSLELGAITPFLLYSAWSLYFFNRKKVIGQFKQ